MELALATPALRMAAYAIDGVLVTLLLTLLLVLLATGTPATEWAVGRMHDWRMSNARGDASAARQALAALLGVAHVLLYFAELVYFGVWECATRGRTPGKFALALRVVSLNGQPPSVAAIGIRNLLRFADMLPGAYGAGLTSMVMSPQGQRLGDHAAGTWVVRAEPRERASELELPADVQPLALSRDQLSRLGPRQLHLARSTLRRVHQRMDRGPQALQWPRQIRRRRGRGPHPTAADQRLLEEVARSLAQSLALGTEEADQSNPLLFIQRVICTGQRKHS